MIEEGAKMANITAADVKQLRDMTSAGMMDCKRALVEAEGDFDKAVKILREKGLAKAAKKAGRIAAEGAVNAKIVNDTGVIVEINCETDFCAKSDRFKEFVDIITDTILENKPADIDALMKSNVKGTQTKVEDLLTDKIATIGENMKIRRFSLLDGTLISYIHDNGRIGTILKIITDKPDDAAVLEAAKNVALQITALNAQYISKENVPQSAIDNEREVQLALVMKEGKPENIAQKTVEGRMRKFYEEITLLGQTYVKDDKLSVEQYVQSVAKENGASIKIDSFVRFERGEGIERKEDNFADEVAEMMKK